MPEIISRLRRACRHALTHSVLKSRRRSSCRANITLFCVVENNPQSVARPSMHAADSMSQIHSIVATSPFHRTVPRCENNRLPLIPTYHFSFRLRARLLLHQNKLAAFPVAPRLPEQKHHL